MGVVLVTEKIADAGLQLLRDAGHEVDVKLDLSPGDLVDAISEANAIIIRSATKVTSEVIDAGRNLQVVGRAGIGLDNVDVEHATSKGVMVVNAPQSNIISAAEHTIGLMIAQARNIPQAHMALVGGSWERSKWEGVELYGKTLGIVGLGHVGALVAQRALALGMKLIAYDPYVTVERAKRMNVQLTSLEELMAESDFVTIHLPKTKDTMGLIDGELLAKSKQGIRIVNAARGGVIDEDALYESIKSGHVGGAALDVFAEEPATGSPLLSLPSVVVTPHLGASTTEAQDKAGITIAEQVILALAGELVPFAVNLAAGSLSESAKPFLPLAVSLGRFLACLHEGLPSSIEIEYQGALAKAPDGSGGATGTSVLTLAVLKGIFAAGTEEPVSYVNVSQLAEDRGLEVRETVTTATRDFVSSITVRSPEHSVAGTISGPKPDSRIVMVDDHVVEVPPSPNMLVVRNDDRPGMIGIVGTVIGKAGVSISSMAVGPSLKGGTALMVLSTGSSLDADTLGELRSSNGILDVHQVSLV